MMRRLKIGRMVGAKRTPFGNSLGTRGHGTILHRGAITSSQERIAPLCKSDNAPSNQESEIPDLRVGGSSPSARSYILLATSLPLHTSDKTVRAQSSGLLAAAMVKMTHRREFAMRHSRIVVCSVDVFEGELPLVLRGSTLVASVEFLWARLPHILSYVPVGKFLQCGKRVLLWQLGCCEPKIVHELCDTYIVLSPFSRHRQRPTRESL